MKSPFNFPMQLPTHDDGKIGQLTILEHRQSQSRRGGTKVAIGFEGKGSHKGKRAAVIAVNLCQN